MPELISHPGLCFYVFMLQGSLTYSLARNSRVPTTYVIHDFELEGESNSDSYGAQARDKTLPGIDASAVGCHLQLIKNDGTLNIKYEGQHGSTAEWSFEGLTTSDRRMMVATAATRTPTDPEHCSACGRDTAVADVKHRAATTSIGIQTTPTSELPFHDQLPQAAHILGPFIKTPAIRGLVYKASRDLMVHFLTSRKILDRNPKVGKSVEALKLLLDAERQSRALKVKQAASPTTKHLQPKTINEPKANRSSNISTQTESSVNSTSLIDNSLVEQSAATSTSLKRKASSSPAPPAPLDKRAKSTHDGPAWPRHLYMTCFRSFPNFKGDVGMLHIDVQEATVWFEGWFGRPHNRGFERKQYDLRDPLTKVMYSPITRPPVDNAKYDLELAKPNPKGGVIRMFALDCEASGWATWGSEEPCVNEEPKVKKTLLPSAKVIVDAIIHCIDVTSRRQAVHDPDAMHALLEHDAKYQKAKDARTLNNLDILNWEFTLDELEIREKRRRALVIYDIEDEAKEKEDLGFFEMLVSKAEKHAPRT